MAKKLKQIFTNSDQVEQTYIINAWHVSQSVDALTGNEDYDITISGSLTLTGSAYWTGDTDAAGIVVDHIVIDQSTGKLYTTGSVGGEDGPQGNQGPSGPQGNQGPAGTPGAGSAIDTYDEGTLVRSDIDAINFVGTGVTAITSGSSGIEVQISAGSGPQGNQGPIGPQGNQGNQGPEGTGTQGNQGPQGNQGAQGPAGGGGSATPGGSDTQVQFNDGGDFGGDSGLTYDKTNDILTITSNISQPSLKFSTAFPPQ